MGAVATQFQAEDEFAAAREQFAQMEAFLVSDEAHSKTHSELERELEQQGRELLRRLYQAHLERRAPGEATAAVRDAQGQVRQQSRRQERGLETVFGEVRVERLGYGGEGLQSLHPLDADLNLPPELYSHQVRPQHKRLWASLEKRPEEVIEQALGEARSRDPTGRKSWVVLVDGHRSQLKTLVRCLRRSGRAAPTIVLDFIHVSEYVWKAGRALHGEVNPKLEGWVGEHLLSILRGRSGYVAGGIRRSATRRGLAGNARQAVDHGANYLLKNAGYLQYDQYLAKGFPIATGVIEGACRYLVKDRMEVTGARWSLAGAEAVLRLRALQASGGGPSPRPQAPSPEAGEVRRSRSPIGRSVPCQIVLPHPTTSPQNAFAAPIVREVHLAFDGTRIACSKRAAPKLFLREPLVLHSIKTMVFADGACKARSRQKEEELCLFVRIASSRDCATDTPSLVVCCARRSPFWSKYWVARDTTTSCSTRNMVPTVSKHWTL